MTPVPSPPSRPAFLAPMNTSGGHSISMESLNIQAFTYEQRNGLLRNLTSAVTNCGGWILDRKNLSPTNIEFCVEIQLRTILDLYAAVISTGIELTRSGHEVLTGLCTRRKHLSLSADLGQVIAIRLEIAFLDDITLHSLLASGSALA